VQVILLLKIAAATLFLYNALLLLYHRGRTTPGWLAAIYLISMACYVVCTGTHGRPEYEVLHGLVLIGCISTPFLFWLVARAIFDDNFRPGLKHGALFITVEGLTIMKHYAFPGEFFQAIEESPAASAILALFPQAFSLVFVGLALHSAFAGRQNDLVEERRQFRKILLFLAGTYALVVLLVEIGLKPLRGAPAILETLHVTILIGFNLLFGLGGLTVSAEILPAAPAKRRPEDSQKKSAPSVPPTATAETLERINQIMEAGEAFREEGLTIRELARRLEMQEYRLRRAINRGLGYRNFNDFVNRYRIRAACEALTDPEQKDVPVIRIAMDLGFGSLAPFNRAFKAQTGTTPTAYRRGGPADVR
jgi:AraC-like DNA-binding protein